jgi:hypothetical protein
MPLDAPVMKPTSPLSVSTFHFAATEDQRPLTRPHADHHLNAGCVIFPSCQPEKMSFHGLSLLAQFGYTRSVFIKAVLQMRPELRLGDVSAPLLTDFARPVRCQTTRPPEASLFIKSPAWRGCHQLVHPGHQARRSGPAVEQSCPNRITWPRNENLTFSRPVSPQSADRKVYEMSPDH